MLSAREVADAFEHAAVTGGGACAGAAAGDGDDRAAVHRGFIFAVQDGELANQSIRHVHVHLIPR